MQDDVKHSFYGKGMYKVNSAISWFNFGKSSNLQEQTDCRNQTMVMDAMGPNIYSTFLNQQHSFPEEHVPNGTLNEFSFPSSIDINIKQVLKQSLTLMLWWLTSSDFSFMQFYWNFHTAWHHNHHESIFWWTISHIFLIATAHKRWFMWSILNNYYFLKLLSLLFIMSIMDF